MPNDPTSVTREVIERFVKSRFANNGCPVCSQNDWTQVHTPDIEIAVPGFDAGRFEMNGYFPIFALYCNNCGYISSHMRSVVQDWLENGEQSSLNLKSENHDG